jgi:Leucine-rich repeat (LRR) protein
MDSRVSSDISVIYKQFVLQLTNMPSEDDKIDYTQDIVNNEGIISNQPSYETGADKLMRILGLE